MPLNPRVFEKLQAHINDYEQTYFILSRKRNGKQCFCFLGLICELYRQETGIGEWFPGMVASTDLAFSTSDQTTSGQLPSAVRAWAGIDKQTEKDITELNDHGKKSFKEILDYLGAENDKNQESPNPQEE